jgi:hypothetical protein
MYIYIYIYIYMSVCVYVYDVRQKTTDIKSFSCKQNRRALIKYYSIEVLLKAW